MKPRKILLIGEPQRQTALSAIAALPAGAGIEVVIRDEVKARKLLQNDAYHAGPLRGAYHKSDDARGAILSRYGVYALSQRVGELKHAGHDIKGEMKTMCNGKRVKVYWMDNEKLTGAERPR